MRKFIYSLITLIACLSSIGVLSGNAQSVSDLIRQEKKRQGNIKPRGNVYTNEDLNRLKGSGAVSTTTLPSEERGLKEREPESTKAKGKEKDTGTDSPAWLNGAEGYEQAFTEHRRKRKPMVLYFYADWCGYCRQFNQEVLTSYEFKQYMRNVPSVRINPEAGESERALARQYGIKGYPSFFILPAGSDQARKVDRYWKQGEQWVAMPAAAFTQACRAAGGPSVD